jgi:tetrahydromethanopterin S-methyltransferase subunit G
MTDEQLLNSLQGTMETIDSYSVKKETIDEYRIDTIEERLTRIEDKVDLLISQLKIEFYKKNDGTSR